MTSDRVDVIVPVYNGEQYLEKSLKSLREQSYENIRVLVVNDGSTDKSLDIIKAFCEEDNRFVCYDRENQGLIRTLNFAIRESSAEYVARMDADDIAHKERIKRQIKYLGENPDVNVCGTLSEYIDKSDAPLPKRKLNLPRSSLACFSRSFIRSPIIHPSVMIRVDEGVKGKLYYDEKDLFCEDYGLWLRIIRSGGKVANVPVQLLSYRVHEGSLSETKKSEMQSNACLLIKDHMKNYGIDLNDDAWNYFTKIRNHDYESIRLSAHFLFFEIVFSILGSGKLERRQKAFLVKDMAKLFFRGIVVKASLL